MTHKVTYIALIAMLLSVSSTANADEPMISGFLQGLYGGGLDKANPTSSEMSASETRLQLRVESFSDAGEFFGRLDFTYDDFNTPAYDWELREAYTKFRIDDNLDFKIGRQIITWGTGDLIFINDVFAKDYRSFFVGRDDQYLKAPQNALRMSFYNPIGTFNFVYSPRFTPNRIPTGQRLSFYSPMAGDVIGGDSVFFEGTMPKATLRNGELAGRFNKYIGSADFALYAYHGFYKNPVGMDMVNMTAYYPRINVFGSSIRFPTMGGIAWIEGGYTRSRDDADGDIITIPNSSVSGLIGFERQLSSNLTVNGQYQHEVMLDHDTYVETLPMGMQEEDETYQLITTRITQMLNMETIMISGFGFYSPSEEDFYGRFSVEYKYSDAIKLAVGGNVFGGEDKNTSFGRFQKNDNAYLKVTYGF